MKYFVWLLKIAIFLPLLAFALNNTQIVTVHFFFGRQWEASMVLIIFLSLLTGLMLGVLGMLSHMWRLRASKKHAQALTPKNTAANNIAKNADADIHGV